MGWHTIPLCDSSPPPAPADLIPIRTSGPLESGDVAVVIKRRTSVSGRGESRSLRLGQRASLPLDVARAMVAAGSAEPIDRTAPWARGITRMLDGDGHEMRITGGLVGLASTS